MNDVTYPQPMQVEHAVTDDDEIGCVPPAGDGVWQVALSADGRTLWRKICLVEVMMQ